MSAAIATGLVEHSSIAEACSVTSQCVPEGEVRKQTDEPIIDPELPIVDAHHHLWLVPESAAVASKADNAFSRGFVHVFRHRRRYLLDEFMADVNTGHNVRATVYLEAHAMYRKSGPEDMKSVGEVEFANGVAAMAASGTFGNVNVCAGIIGRADLRIGDGVEEVLSAHVHAGNGRYRGVRYATLYDPDLKLLPRFEPQVLLDKRFRAGFKCLQKLGLSFDACVLEPQLPEVIDLARAFPGTQIILDHVGLPVGAASYEGKREERFPLWRDNIRTLSRCENVTVKLGGLGTGMSGFKSLMATPPFTSEQLAGEWKPYIETCIEAFGADRCMFESGFPVESPAGCYPVLWNAFKRLAASASQEEKTALFSGTATRVYRLDV